jgi:hypothetical protein
MNQVKSISTFAILVILFGCGGRKIEEPSVTFVEPQPIKTDNLSKFPNRLKGQYYCPTDNSKLLIEDNLISKIYDYDQKVLVAQLDSSFKLSGDTIINLGTNEKTLTKRVGDTLIVHTHYIDTVFRMNYDNVVRKFKGYYFLNKRYDEGSWEVKKADLSSGKLTIGSISSSQEIETLKSITESSKDTIMPFKFVLSKKQFKDFIKRDGFSDSEIFVKVK